MTRGGVDKGCERIDGGGGDCWCKVEAAAAVNPKDRRAEGKRRSVEENSLKVVPGKRENYKRKSRGVGRMMRSEQFCVFPMEINHLPASRPLAF